MIKTTGDGNEIGYADFFPESQIGTINTINWLVDSSLVLGYWWTDTNPITGTVGVLKCNRSGSLVKTNPMFMNPYSFSDAVTTFDNKILLVGGFFNGILNSHAYKLNSDLEYDSVYSALFTYDSLCPHPIVPDTIPLDCEVVGIDDPGQDIGNSTLKAFPNPVADVLTIHLPDQVSINKQFSSFTVSTSYFRWQELAMELYDLKGQCKVRQMIPFDQKEVKFNVSGWANGLYLIRLTYHNETVATCKFVKISNP